jgi:hypothetical protein
MKWIRSLAVGLVLLAAVSHAAGPDTGGWGALDLSTSLRGLLATGTWGLTPQPFRIVALSFLADGCAAEARRNPHKQQAARACVQRCLELADRTGHLPLRPDTDDGMWLTHYSLILGAADALGPCPDPVRHHAISVALARRSLRDPHRHVASYAAMRHRWPADQTATLASLARFDRAHAARLHEEPAREWREFVLGKATDRRLGLPWSEVTGAQPTSREPRGCALSWQTRFVHEFDDPLARQWWTAYRSRYLVERAGLVGFREWPPGRDRGMDGDSGPIVAGVGAAATGLGIAAARVMGDEDLAEKIERTAAVVGTLAAGVPGAHGVLADAIRYLGAEVRR